MNAGVHKTQMTLHFFYLVIEQEEEIQLHTKGGQEIQEEDGILKHG